MAKPGMLDVFMWPTALSILAFIYVFNESGLNALLLVITLTILEVTLSFDNAVVNAKVLERMSPIWQRRFLTWGIVIAVFGTRLVLPIVIVSVAVWQSPWFITQLAFTNPEEYSHLLEGVHASITSFGGMFLLMVSLKYFFNVAKEKHWITSIERYLVKWGRIEALEIGIALILLTVISTYTHYDQTSVLVSGIVGLLLFIFMEGLASSLSIESKNVANGGLALFLYLNVLDSAFSLDGVVGAFALTTNLLIIVIGLGVGAYFVRSLTLYFVRQKTLTELVYLEHGAHWAILGLAVAMFANLLVHVPETMIGLVGLIFVAFSYHSSIKEKRAKE
jgi:uncharacterized protein